MAFESFNHESSEAFVRKDPEAISEEMQEEWKQGNGEFYEALEQCNSIEDLIALSENNEVGIDGTIDGESDKVYSLASHKGFTGELIDNYKQEYIEQRRFAFVRELAKNLLKALDASIEGFKQYGSEDRGNPVDYISYSLADSEIGMTDMQLDENFRDWIARFLEQYEITEKTGEDSIVEKTESLRNDLAAALEDVDDKYKI